MSGWKKLAAAAAGDDAIAPEGVSFDGQNDYLSRTSGLSGATDGKTFTLSFWFYSTSTSGDQRVYHSNDTGSGWPRFTLLLNLSGSGANLITIASAPTDGTFRLNISSAAYTIVLNTWTHVLVSFDMTSQANSKIYVNDAPISVTYGTFTNTNLAFDNDEHKIGAESSSAGRLKGRLAHFYFDYTYRNLGTESNRRLFITDELKPAEGLASLSPIIYLPMTDADTAGDNSGTGGDFTVNGTLDTAQRGPNQTNCVASKFDGSNDHLYKSISQVIGSVLTCSFTFKQNSTSAVSFNAYNGGASSASTQVQNANYANPFRVILRNSSGTQICNIESSFRVPQYSEASVQVSLDISNSSDRKIHMFLNGVEDTSVSETFYTSDTTFRLADETYINGGNGAEYHNGTMGEFYLDTAYIDLTSDNPFWDSENGLHKPVSQVIEETGNTPRIALPMIALNPGLNLGTEGNYTQNGGAYGGGRGGSEYIQRSCWTGSSSPRGYLTNNSVFSGVSNSKQLTFFLALNRRDNAIGRYLFKFYKGSSPSSTYMQLRGNAGNGAYWYFNSQNGGQLLNAISSSAVFSSQDWNVFAFSVDLTNTSNRHFYKNRSSESMNWQDYQNADIPWSQFDNVAIFSDSSTSSSQYWNQYTGPFYLATEYVDFSDEEKMNLFVNQLGFPKKLSASIDAGLIPNPVIYLPFDEVDDFGKNLGTGGDFTVNNTLASASDVDPDA
jgi:hypothetical protein